VVNAAEQVTGAGHEVRKATSPAEGREKAMAERYAIKAVSIAQRKLRDAIRTELQLDG
jgi:hypothetical protein